MPYSLQLPGYSIGDSAYEEIDAIVSTYGSSVVVIGGKTALEKSRPRLEAALAHSGIEVVDWIVYGHNCTYERVDALCGMPTVQQADMIFGVGGGRAVDTVKVVANRLDKPLFAFPTLGSNCAAATNLSVVYKDDDSLAGYDFQRGPCHHVFIDTTVIAQSPVELLWAGIADGMSKECEVKLQSRGRNLSHAPLMGRNVCSAVTPALMDFGLQALEDCRAGRSSQAIEEVALAIIMTCGYVSNMTVDPGQAYYYNSSLAHAFYNSSTAFPECVGKHLHGEIVSYGVLALLQYDGDMETKRRYVEFYKQMGFPLTLADLDLQESDIPELVSHVPATTEWKTGDFDLERFAQAIIDAQVFA
ncbi:iron-containing alcohol dehydrogenase family protein [Corynebacterium diphtheriae]|uniref:iron-containing alcohol dehydrogenase family protein n=1 Tax=Corynebacterium diphtheriae TaxID=1717 RepID=UPI000245AB3A|nr:iron-containing alcohol dehydrogenase family protein [Corynebacterium diphtheriae]AEX42560.1 hypothetical protein CD31A_1893 [Corynebacterium diphtheriae 31A]AEX70513.1 hypothetical protein CDPW8_1865 [Corynebacterium diphtheriae PW8]OKY22567.1 glycerol dehydrogenase [Corynebacterium diphtheriae]OSQ11375.1 glycerol dehydrogenase [Corynebacterium diphtheriae]UEB38184.1 iron-containing alcohol dehydrogenase family protein [Corynebacterium diphtheriae]